MNTNHQNTEERFEGEDAADALFASILVESPKWLDERILATAHQAVMASESTAPDPEWEELLQLEQAADAMFAQLMVEPPPEVDERISALAEEELIKSYPIPDWLKITVNGVMTVGKKLQAANDDWFWGQEFTFCPRAAAADESTDDLSNGPGGMLHADVPSGVDSLLLGDFTLLITTDFADSTKKSMCIMVGGERAEMYEGCIVEVRKGEAIKLSGPIEFGQFEAPIPADTKFEPPYSLNVRFPKDVEVIQQDTLE